MVKMSIRTWVSGETGRPALLASPITGPARRVTSTAGARVSSGASSERNTTSSRATMNKMDRSRPRVTAFWPGLAGVGLYRHRAGQVGVQVGG